MKMRMEEEGAAQEVLHSGRTIAETVRKGSGSFCCGASCCGWVKKKIHLFDFSPAASLSFFLFLFFFII